MGGVLQLFIAFLLFELQGRFGTIGKGIIHPEFVTNGVIAGTLLGACAWNILTWYWGLPTSSSHALIGGFIGAGLVHHGWEALAWSDGILRTVDRHRRTLRPWLVMGLGIAIAVFWMFRYARPRSVDTIFRRGQLLSAALYSIGHGGNDAQKTMGVIFVLIIAATQTDRNLQWHNRFAVTAESFTALEKGSDRMSAETLASLKPLQDRHFSRQNDFETELARVLSPADLTRYQARIIKAADHAQVPTEMVLACHLAMGLGTLMGGWRIVKTMGQRISRLRPVDGFVRPNPAQ